jgi:hypothetical protein
LPEQNALTPDILSGPDMSVFGKIGTQVAPDNLSGPDMSAFHGKIGTQVPADKLSAQGSDHLWRKNRPQLVQIIYLRPLLSGPRQGRSQLTPALPTHRASLHCMHAATSARRTPPSPRARDGELMFPLLVSCRWRSLRCRPASRLPREKVRTTLEAVDIAAAKPPTVASRIEEARAAEASSRMPSGAA